MRKILVLYDKWMREDSEKMWRASFKEALARAQNMVRLGKVNEPRKAESEMYQNHYNRWMDTRESLFQPWCMLLS